VPPRPDVLGRDEVVGSRVPGALPGELEEERLPVGELDDGALRGGLHEHSPDAAGVVGDRPALGDERLKRAHEGVVVNGVEGGRPESAGERGALPGAGHVREFGQTREVHGDRQAPLDPQPARDVDGLLVGQGVPQGDEQLRAGVLVADVLHLVDVDDHHDVFVPDRRAADLDEEVGQGDVRLGPVLRAHGQRDAGGGDGLDPAQEVADALLPGGGQTRRRRQVQERGGDPFERVGAGGDAQLRRGPVPRLGRLARDPAHERGLAGAGLPEDGAAPLVQAGGAARAQDVAPVAEVGGAAGPHLGHGVGARAER